MSKRRKKHRNRARRGPSNRPQRTPNKPNNILAWLNRNKLRIILAIGVSTFGVYLGINKLSDKTKSQGPAPVSVPHKTPKPVMSPIPPEQPQASKLPQYEEWADKIELPEVQLDEKHWSKEQIIDHFVPKGIDQDKLNEFHELFTEAKNKFDWQISQAGDAYERDRIYHEFMKDILGALGVAHKDETGRKKWPSSKINRLLIPNGLWLSDPISAGRGRKMIALFHIDQIQSLQLSGKDHGQIPLVALSRPEALSNSQKPLSLPPVSTYRYKSVIISKEYIDRMLSHDFQRLGRHPDFSGRISNLNQAKKDHFKTLFNHEGAHGALDILHGIGTRDRNRPAGLEKGVNMGAYTIDENRLKGATLGQIHEIFGRGYGLMKSGTASLFEVVDITALGGSDRMHSLERRMLIIEMTHSNSIDDQVKQALKQSLQGQRIKPHYFELAAIQIPDKEWHRIGERMAKLGLHLTQQAKKQ